MACRIGAGRVRRDPHVETAPRAPLRGGGNRVRVADIGEGQRTRGRQRGREIERRSGRRIAGNSCPVADAVLVIERIIQIADAVAILMSPSPMTSHTYCLLWSTAMFSGGDPFDPK